MPILACHDPDDTIICLGDVAHPDAWRDRRLVLDIRDCPGKRVLVLGNHDLFTQRTLFRMIRLLAKIT